MFLLPRSDGGYSEVVNSIDIQQTYIYLYYIGKCVCFMEKNDIYDRLILELELFDYL